MARKKKTKATRKKVTRKKTTKKKTKATRKKVTRKKTTKKKTKATRKKVTRKKTTKKKTKATRKKVTRKKTTKKKTAKKKNKLLKLAKLKKADQDDSLSQKNLFRINSPKIEKINIKTGNPTDVNADNLPEEEEILELDKDDFVYSDHTEAQDSYEEEDKEDLDDDFNDEEGSYF